MVELKNIIATPQTQIHTTHNHTQHKQTHTTHSKHNTHKYTICINLREILYCSKFVTIMGEREARLS